LFVLLYLLSRLGNPFVVPLIQAMMALSGVVAAWRGGLFRKLLTGLNILDLVCLPLAYVGMYLIWGAPLSALFSDFGFLCRTGLVLAGVALAVLLATGKPLWCGFGALLPLRGLHARRLLAGVALVGLVSPWLEIMKNFLLMDGVSSPSTALQGGWLLVCSVLYLLPFCETLARAEPRKVTA
jgi:hypothetical protein